MEQTSRVKLKIGPHEIDAEGSPELLKEQLETFKQLVELTAKLGTPSSETPAPAQRPAVAPEQPPVQPQAASAVVPPPPSDAPVRQPEDQLTRIMRVDGRVISLTVRPQSADDALLLLLYGQKVLRNNDTVTGSEIIDGIEATGGLQIGRIDRLMEKTGAAGDVIVFGERRGKRYRLTNTGMQRARTIAADLIATVA